MTLALPKSKSHGRIGEAAVTAKCWMNGIQAHNTNGLRANFAGCDLIIDTANPRRKLLIQVKSGYGQTGKVYLTQASGLDDLVEHKFKADFVVFMNIEQKVGMSHQHLGTLRFEHLTFFVVPADVANQLYRQAVQRDYVLPKRDGGRRSLNNLAVFLDAADFDEYREAWHLLRAATAAET